MARIAWLVGSLAAAHQRDDFYRTPQDIDIICNREAFEELKDKIAFTVVGAGKYVGIYSGKYCEVTIGTALSDRYLLDVLHREMPAEYRRLHSVNIAELQCLLLPLEWLHGMKIAHRYKPRSRHFKKTMADIHWFRQAGIALPANRDWIRQRSRESCAPAPKLSVSKNQFFDTPGVRYKYDHDTLHLAVANDYLQPVYQYILADGQEVMCDKVKWDAISNTSKLLAVLEEALVLALERHQIPNNFEPDRERSFQLALKSICTYTTSGWFREYAWENYNAVVELYTQYELTHGDYTIKFKQCLENGIVKELP